MIFFVNFILVPKLFLFTSYFLFYYLHTFICLSILLMVASFCFVAEADKQRLSHALRLLSETEKQLRMSKNQSTWLTVALLQLSSLESSSSDANDSKSSLRIANMRGQDVNHYC